MKSFEKMTNACVPLSYYVCFFFLSVLLTFQALSFDNCTTIFLLYGTLIEKTPSSMSKIMVYRGRGRDGVEEHLKMLKWHVQKEVYFNIEQT
jgi:hypothetical protein